MVMTFIFNPEEWLTRPDSKRLSTCRNKFENYGLTLVDITNYFRILCQHKTAINLNRNTTSSFVTYVLYRNWLDQNCFGYWYDVYTHDSYDTQNIYMFQSKDDAIKFKLFSNT